MATGLPFSRRPSLVITHTFLLPVSCPWPQTFIHGEYISCGWSAACCWGCARLQSGGGWGGVAFCAGCKGCAGGAGCAFGAAFGAALGCGCCAEAVFANSVAAKVMTMVAVNARPHGRTDTVR